MTASELTQKKLALDGEHVCAVLGEVTSEKTLLIPLDRPALMTEGEVLTARLGNYRYCGVFATKNGLVNAAPEDDTDGRLLMLTAIPSYVEWLAQQVDPLERLALLIDPRAN